MKKCSRVKNPCKICLESVTNKTGLQCKGACKKWVHFTCLNYTPGKIQDIKAGIIIVTCPCPNCNNQENPKETLSNPPFTCEKQECPANATTPKCEDKDCPMNNKTTAAAPIPANQIAETHPTQKPKVEASKGDSTPNIPTCCAPKTSAPETTFPCGSTCKISKTGYPPSNQIPQQNPPESKPPTAPSQGPANATGSCIASGVQSDTSVSNKNSKTKQKDSKPKSPKSTKSANDATLPKCCQPSQSPQSIQSPEGTQSPESTPSPKSKKSPKRTKSPKSASKSKKSADKLPKSLSCSCVSVNEVKKPSVKEAGVEKPGANEPNKKPCTKELCAKEANAKKTGVKESGSEENHAPLKSGHKKTSHSDSKLSAANDTDLLCTIAELCSAVGNLSDQLKELMCKMLKNAEKK